MDTKDNLINSLKDRIEHKDQIISILKENNSLLEYQLELIIGKPKNSNSPLKIVK